MDDPINGTRCHEFSARLDRRTLLLAVGSSGLASALPSVQGRARAMVQTCQEEACLAAQWGSGWAPPGRLSGPKALALGPDGSLYVVDAGHDQVQRFTQDGEFLAQFRIPATEEIPLQPRRELGDLAVHPSGDVYVIDNPISLFVPPGERPTSYRIVRFTSEGEFLQEWGSTGSAQGQFIKSTGIAITNDGDILVADAGNRRIQHFTPDGVFLDQWSIDVQIVGARATPEAVQRAPGEFVAVTPVLVEVAPDGTVYTAIGASEQRIQRFQPDGTFLGAWSGRHLVYALAFDTSGNVYSTRTGALPGRVSVHGPTGELLREWEIGGICEGIAVDAERHVYVAGVWNAPLQKFDSEGKLLATWGGTNPTPPPGALEAPRGIAVDTAGTVFVADTGNRRVQQFTSVGGFLAEWTGDSLGLGRELHPTDVAIDPSGDIVILDDRRSILRLSQGGRLLQQWSVTEDARCSSVAVDHRGRVFVAADSVRVFSRRGALLSSWLQPDSDGGPPREPWAVAVDDAEHVFVTGLEASAVCRFTTEGTLLDIWRGAGMGAEEMLGFPYLAVDSSGNVYVAHFRTVQKWTGDGSLLCSWETAAPLEAGFPWVSGVAVSGDDYVYITEEANNQVKKFAQRDQMI